MKRAADFRQIARDALSGRWGKAILAGLIAGLLGATSYAMPGLSVDVPTASDMASVERVFEDERMLGIFLIVFTVTMLVVSVIGVVQASVAGIIGVGYSRFNLDYVDRQAEPSIGTLFGSFKNWKTIVGVTWLRALYVFLWTLLFIVPGIIADYNYAMVYNILAEHPELSVTQALDRSKELMYGNRWRLFCLQWSFIGWDLLCILSLGVGSIWLVPYRQAAMAAFYRDISGEKVCRQEAA